MTWCGDSGSAAGVSPPSGASAPGRAKRYDPNAHRPHQHLVCSGCGAMRDVRPSADPLAALPAGERFGFAVSGAVVTYHGRCPDCLAAGSAASAPDG